MLDPKDIVRTGYDAASYHYRGDAGIRPGEEQSEDTLKYHEWLDVLEERVTPGSRILELGCGCGLPVAQRLAGKYPYLGVDISPVQCERARQNAPEGEILCADITTLDFSTGHFDAVLAFFSIIHVPVDEHRALFEKIAAWLAPGGLLLVTLPLGAWTGTGEDWRGSGAVMYWSHADTATYLGWMDALGLKIEWTHFLPEGGDGFNLVLARRKRATE